MRYIIMILTLLLATVGSIHAQNDPPNCTSVTLEPVSIDDALVASENEDAICTIEHGTFSNRYVLVKNGEQQARRFILNNDPAVVRESAFQQYLATHAAREAWNGTPDWMPRNALDRYTSIREDGRSAGCTEKLTLYRYQLADVALIQDRLLDPVSITIMLGTSSQASANSDTYNASAFSISGTFEFQIRFAFEPNGVCR